MDREINELEQKIKQHVAAAMLEAFKKTTGNLLTDSEWYIMREKLEDVVHITVEIR